MFLWGDRASGCQNESNIKIRDCVWYRFALDFPSICMRYVWNVTDICQMYQRYAEDMSNISKIYALDIPEI